MLQNIKELYGNKLAASDGGIGFVKDFYFDDNTWVIRYLVVDTGTWLSDRKILLTPHVFGALDRDKNILSIKLTRKQIEDSPSIDSHRPVSRQYEQDYYRYYGWPGYWEGGGMWGVAGFPVIDEPPVEKKRPHHGHNQRDDVHLRSTKAVNGYKIHATDGMIGSIRSFMVDDKSWEIGELVVETGHWYSGKVILIPSLQIERISYEESKIFVNFTRAAIQQAADHDVVKIGG